MRFFEVSNDLIATFHIWNCVFCRYDDPTLKQVIRDTKTLQADLLELSLLETLVLCRKGKAIQFSCFRVIHVDATVHIISSEHS